MRLGGDTEVTVRGETGDTEITVRGETGDTEPDHNAAQTPHKISEMFSFT